MNCLHVSLHNKKQGRDCNALYLMNTHTQLKKGDICASPWGKVTIEEDQRHSALITVSTECGNKRIIAIEELTRIPSFQERIEAVLDIAWDVENRLEPHETVQLTVAQFVEFARFHVAIFETLEFTLSNTKEQIKSTESAMEQIEKLLKGETL